MSSPIGHTIVAVAMARRLGARSPRALAAAAALGSLPDIDLALGAVLHGDAWRLHRGGTHTLAFALGSGALAGAFGLISAGAGGRRSVLGDAMTGAAIGGTHLFLDNLPYIRLSVRPWVPPPLRRRILRMSIANWLLDVLQCSVIAWALLPRHRDRAGPADGVCVSDRAP